MQQKWGWKPELCKEPTCPLQTVIQVQHRGVGVWLPLPVCSPRLLSAHYLVPFDRTWEADTDYLGSGLLQVWFNSILKFLSKWLIYFPLMDALCMCCYVRSVNSEKPSMLLSPNPQPCNAMWQLREAESHAGLWNRQRHKSHLGLLQSKLLFCNNLPVKKVLTSLLNGWLALLLLFSHLFWSMSLSTCKIRHLI